MRAAATAFGNVSRCVAVLAVVGSWLTACGGTLAAVTPPDTGRHTPQRLFPFERGAIWSFNVSTGEGLPTFATLRVLEIEGGRITTQRNRQAPNVYLRDDEGIRTADGAWVLRAPIVMGATWPGPDGRTATVTAVDETVRTGLGTHHDCVRVVEVDTDIGIEAATVYCPDVGPALVVSGITSTITGARIEVRATLIGRNVVAFSRTREADAEQTSVTHTTSPE